MEIKTQEYRQKKLGLTYLVGTIILIPVVH